MDFGKYVDLELGLQLKEKDFDEMCGYIFVNHRRVKDEIKTKYPGLSDCGYDELTKKWGGELEEDEVYGQYTDPYQENIKNSWIEPDEKMRLCAMPTLDDARRWLRKQHNIHVVVSPEVNYFKGVCIVADEYGLVAGNIKSITIYNPKYNVVDNRATRFYDYDEAVLAGIKAGMYYVKSEKKI